MKNLIFLLLLVCCSSGAAQIINFPDANFKNALINTNCVDTNGDNIHDANADTNKDGEIDIDEALNVKSLNVANRRISNLDGIQYFKNVEILSCNNNQLKDLDVKDLTKVIRLDCNSNQINNLDVKALTNMIRFDCYSNQLSSLDLQGLTNLNGLYCQNNQLTSLDVQGLRNLEFLWCFENKLTTILIKGTPLRIVPFNFRLNRDLKYICCDEEVIEPLKDKAISFGIQCEVNSYCTFTPGEEYFVLNGFSYFDLELNGCENPNTTFPYIKYQIFKENSTESYIAASDGFYSIPLTKGNYSITPVVENYDNFEAIPSNFTVIFPSTSDTITQNICIQPKEVLKKIDVKIIPLNANVMPGLEASYKIIWRNIGHETENGKLVFTYDETFIDFLSGSERPDLTNNGQLEWNFSNLLPFEKREIIFTVKVNSSNGTTTLNNGDKLYFTASILDNKFSLESTVGESLTSNNKVCLQGTSIHPDKIGQFVDFVIRFANISSSEAKNVVIKDIIDTTTFDISTLEVWDASHRMFTKIKDNKVEFFFENIVLPFEENKNSGYVAFKIKTLPTMMVGDSLKNSADVYFDFNFPIRTNESQTIIAIPSNTDEWVSKVKIFPNPTQSILNFNANENWNFVEIYDLSGRIIKASSINNSSLDVGHIQCGTYILRLKNGTKVGYSKFIKL